MRLATFNIRHGRSRSGAVDVAALRRACAGLAADVLALQEVDVGTDRVGGADLVAEVAEASGMAPAFNPTLERHPGQYGNALLVRGALDDVEMLALPRWHDAEPRGAIVATAVLEGGARVSVGACHLGLGGLPRGSEARAQLGDVRAHLGRRPSPRAGLGDLHLPSRRVRPLVEAAGMVLAGGPPTFPARFAFRRIDHLAVAGLTLGPVSVRRAPVSDHRPLVVEASTAR